MVRKSVKPKLSVCLIVRDEEAVLDRCLQSFAFEGKPIWDELVVCDTGSTDNTIAIAQKHGARIEHFQWNDNHSDARNYAESKCKGEWILWIDADEVLVEGHEEIRRIVSGPINESGIKPRMVFDRDAVGNPSREYSRQELLHRNDGKWQWHGAVHEWLAGPSSNTYPQIVMEHLGRPGPDRPTVSDMFEALRQNLANTLDERHLYYLLREHWYKGRHQETIALVDFALAQPATWSQQRSDMAILAGHAWKAMGKPEEARKSYLRAVEEWGAWAEPYYWLGMLHYELGQWAEGAAWFYASLPFDPPVDFFTDQAIYTWRRYDQLAVCLHNLGKNEEAKRYGWLAIVANPKDPRLRENMGFYREATSPAQSAGPPEAERIAVPSTPCPPEQSLRSVSPPRRGGGSRPVRSSC